MARKFITERELALIDSWTRELVQDIVSQEIIYYAISYEESSVHPVYDEAVTKEYRTPTRIFARVEFTQLATKTGFGSLDATYGLAVELHADECRQRNIIPREGDFIEHGQVMFEVTSVGHAEPVFGQINDKLAYKLTCTPSRQGQFQTDNVASDGIDNTHPVEPARARTLGDDL